jgi:hypothetical protein
MNGMSPKRITDRQDHGKTLDSPHVGWLEITDPNQQSIAHLLDRDIVDQSTDHRSWLRLAKVDLLNIERIRIWMLFDCVRSSPVRYASRNPSVRSPPPP